MELFPIFSSFRLCKAPMAAGIDFRLLPRSDKTVMLETSNKAEGKLSQDVSRAHIRYVSNPYHVSLLLPRKTCAFMIVFSRANELFVRPIETLLDTTIFPVADPITGLAIKAPSLAAVVDTSDTFSSCSAASGVAGMTRARVKVEALGLCRLLKANEEAGAEIARDIEEALVGVLTGLIRSSSCLTTDRRGEGYW